MKDKIIEVLKEAYPRQDIIMEWAMSDTVDLRDALEKWRVNIATRIDSLYPTLNRDKVKATLVKDHDVYSWDELVEKVTDDICSLSLPTLSEEEIEIAAAKLGQAEQPKNKELRKWLSRGFRKGAKWATKQLAKPKEE
jgi:hypothetical protein